MKLSFSTRGWPNLSWEEMLDTAQDMGFSGVEVYNLPKFNPLLDKTGPFHKYQTAATVRQLRELKLQIPCFDTSCDISAADCRLEDLEVLMEAYKIFLAVPDAAKDKEKLLSLLSDKDAYRDEIIYSDKKETGGNCGGRRYY